VTVAGRAAHLSISVSLKSNWMPLPDWLNPKHPLSKACLVVRSYQRRWKIPNRTASPLSLAGYYTDAGVKSWDALPKGQKRF